MKRYISVWMLLARSTVYKMLAILLGTAAAHTAAFYLLKPGRTLERVFDHPAMQVIFGAGLVLLTLLLGLLFVLVHAFSKARRKGSYLVVVRYSGECSVETELSRMPNYRLKNKSITAGATELVAEVSLTDEKLQAVEALQKEPGVERINIMRSVAGSIL